jgi:hypothetical protein
MTLREYVRGIQDLLDSSPRVITYSLSFDERSTRAAFLQGRIVFTDWSTLHFKEFLIADREVRRVKYGYHWAGSDGSLRVRYDNAADPAARHLVTFPHHRHTPAGIEEAREPTLAQLLSEIAGLLSER